MPVVEEIIRNLAFRHSDIFLGLYINNSNWFGIPTHLKVFWWSRENILWWTSWKVEWNVCLWLTGSFSRSIANIIKYYLYLTYFVTFYPLGSVLLDRTLTCMRTLYSTYTGDWTILFYIYSRKDSHFHENIIFYIYIRDSFDTSCTMALGFKILALYCVFFWKDKGIKEVRGNPV